MSVTAVQTGGVYVALVQESRDGVLCSTAEEVFLVLRSGLGPAKREGSDEERTHRALCGRVVFFGEVC